MTKQKPLGRGAGILMPVSSLPSDHGIGTFGSEAYKFVDFLKKSGQKYWQVLPLGPTSYGDSPYQSFSAFSGNPYFIDLHILEEEGLIKKGEAEKYSWGDNETDIDYAIIYKNRFKLLKKAYKRSTHKLIDKYKKFCIDNEVWLPEYSIYMAVKTKFGGKEWSVWEEDIRNRKPEALKKYSVELSDEIDFWKFCQYKFFEQWEKLKSYANKNGIKIIGDIPIYVALDSADVWAHPEQFQLDENRCPVKVAGVPPDMFSATGQLWGNPLYDWEHMENENYAWWRRRMSFSAQMYDIIRIDHFVGIAHYYSIPAEEKTALNGTWIDGPREKLLTAISESVNGKRIIAEDLGISIPIMGRMMKKFGYPGMKLMQFAFDSDKDNPYLPYQYEKNSVVYGGTHDNETLAGYFSHQPKKVLKYARDFLNIKTNKEISDAIVREGYKCCADTVIFQIQDLLGLGNEARINTPSTIGCNWRWRLKREQLTEELTLKIYNMTVLYGR